MVLHWYYQMAWLRTTSGGERLGITFAGICGRSTNRAHLPLYQQLQRALRDAIENRVIGPDDALPPERDLAGELGVSRITVRKAIDGLVEEGLLMRRQGSGTFVSNRVEKNFAKLTSFSEDMRARGRSRAACGSSAPSGTVTPEESLTLRSSPGHAGVSLPSHSLCGRRADGARIRDGARGLPALARGGRDLAVRSAGSAPATARCARCSACAPCCSRAEQAKLLQGAGAATPGLLVERVGYLTGRARGGVLAVLLPRRHLRLRGRAQRSIVNGPITHVPRGRPGAARGRRDSCTQNAPRLRGARRAAARSSHRAPS